MESETPILSKQQVIFRIAVIVAVAELLIMLLLGYLPLDLDILQEAAIDTLALIILSTPPIYFFIIKPFVNDWFKVHEEISHLAHIDPLTQLANRRLLTKHMDQLIAAIRRRKHYGALLMIDLDGFKPVNDTYGHDIGDLVLVEASVRMQANTREEDIVSRIGGDEFLILISNLGFDEAEAKKRTMLIAEKLITSISSPMEIANNTLNIGCSIGVRILRFEDSSSEMVIKDADQAMYNAKKQGKGRTNVF